MERRRRRRKKKNGGIDPEELRHRQDNDDAMSVISTSSSKRRHYLDPTPTTGRMVRGARVRSSYSRFGEPFYDIEKRRRSSIGSHSHHSEWNGLPNEQQERPSSRHSNGYGGRPLSRARSMTDVRVSGDVDRRSLRRSRSSNSFGRMSGDVTDSGYNDTQSNSETDNMYEFLNLKPGKEVDNNSPPFRNNRPASPTQSAYSIRTAPSWTGQDYRINNMRSQSTSRQTTNGAYSAYHDRPMPRSMSQPDLSRIVDSKTYPQGILKKDAVGDGRNRRSTGSHYNYSGNQGDTHTGNEYNGHYPQHPRSSMLQQANDVSNDQANARASSRPSSALSYRPQSYDPYHTGRYGDYGVYGGYGHAPAYSTSGYHRHHQLPGKYTGGYDQYGNYNDYWANYSHNQRMSMY